jgi:hypothetical protein
MPSPDYRYQTYVLVACSGGSAEAAEGEGPRGKFVSKAQTRLAFAVADVHAWGNHFGDGEEAGFKNEIDFHVLLQDATHPEVADAIAEAVDHLDFHFDDSKGGSLNFVFSGHGYPDGDLALEDGPLSADQLMEWCTAGRAGQNGNTRHLRLVIDSCYAGLSLARMMIHPTHWTKAVIRDALAACLPSQEAFELPSVGHSVLTYTRLRPYANEMPPSGSSTEEEHRRWMDEEYPHWRAARRETTQYLTNGRQHALDLINGHAIGLASNAGRSVDVADWPEKIELDKLVVALDHLPRSGRPYKW